MVQSICMTGADLNSSSKPWWVQEKTSKVVYGEFHEQVREGGSCCCAVYIHIHTTTHNCLCVNPTSIGIVRVHGLGGDNGGSWRRGSTFELQ